MILTALKEEALEKAGTVTVADVRIGLSYTAVLLDNGSAGVAMTFRNELSGGCIARDRPLVGKKVSDLIARADSSELLDRTVGIAAVNAVMNRQDARFVPGDIIEVLVLNPEDTVGMVGFFGPLVPKIRQKVKTLYIFEKLEEKAPGLLSEEKAFELLPSCSVAIITSTTLINQTFEKLVAAAGNCRKIILTGASTPLAPEVFKPYQIEMLSGIVVSNTGELLQIISEGGGMRSFKGHIEKVNIMC